MSNPGVEPVEVESIVITFPLSQDIAADLSGDKDLPQPLLETPGAWRVDSEGPSVNIQPEDPDTNLVFSGNPLIFLLQGIKVNTKPGTVKITISQRVITEEGGSRLVTGAALLEKQPTDFPVQSFSAHPAAVDDLDKTVLLKWTCRPEGEKRSYRLRGPGTTDSRYTCADGSPKGIQVKVTGSTIYSLEVLRGDELQQTLYTPVEVAKVSLESTWHLNASPSGRMVRAGWRAKNALKCTVMVNNVTVDKNAPADTYGAENRYQLFLSGENGPGPDIRVVAEGVSGAQAGLTISNTNELQPPISLQISGGYNRLRIAPNGKLALLIPSGFSAPEIIIADLVERQTPKKRIPIADVQDAAFSSDGSWVLVAAGQSLVRVNVATSAIAWTIKIPDPLIGPGGVWAVALSPDDKRAFVLVGVMGLNEIALPTGEILNSYLLLPGIPLLGEVALSADGKTIVVMRNDLHVIDRTQTPPVTKRIYGTDG